MYSGVLLDDKKIKHFPVWQTHITCKCFIVKSLRDLWSIISVWNFPHNIKIITRLDIWMQEVQQLSDLWKLSECVTDIRKKPLVCSPVQSSKAALWLYFITRILKRSLNKEYQTPCEKRHIHFTLPEVWTGLFSLWWCVCMLLQWNVHICVLCG